MEDNFKNPWIYCSSIETHGFCVLNLSFNDLFLYINVLYTE